MRQLGWYWIFVLCMPFFGFVEASSGHTGTLIVSYQTGPKKERIDRVRFRLKDCNQCQQMYPKGGNFADDPENLCRTVVLRDILAGSYKLEFIYPNGDGLFESVPEKNITVQSGQITRVDQVIRPRYATLKASAVFNPPSVQSTAPPTITLRDNDEKIRAQSTVGKLVSRNLIPGLYTVIFEPLPGFKQPEPQKIVLEPYEVSKEITGIYELETNLTNKPNLLPERKEGNSSAGSGLHEANSGRMEFSAAMPSGEKLSITIEGEGDLNPFTVTLVSNTGRVYWKSTPLPPGIYRIKYDAPPKYFPLPPQTIKLIAGKVLYINPSFILARTLKVKTNLPEAEFTLEDKTDKKKLWFGRGKEFVFNNLSQGSYTLRFAPAKNSGRYIPPQDMQIAILDNKEAEVRGIYQLAKSFVETDPAQKESIIGSEIPIELVNVPAGEAYIGDLYKEGSADETPAKKVWISEFSIGKYPVTNSEFTKWLNQALKNNSIAYVEEADNAGMVIDQEGNLLCKTKKADPYSEIEMVNGEFTFADGKANFPVINATWHGADAFCRNNGYRLPTEPEWEKAASHTDDLQIKKFRYGFSNNEINRTWANYKESDSPIKSFQVLTTPVGFYNGQNVLPLIPGQAAKERTHLSISPYGAFDMSGNVWEWTADWYASDYLNNLEGKDPAGPQNGDKKVAKGGCYDSLSDGLRVSKRLPLPMHYSDSYTGFRVAK